MNLKKNLRCQKKPWFRLIALCLAFVLFISSVGFAEVIDLRQKGDIELSDAALAAIAGFLQGALIQPSYNVWNVFYKTYLIPVAADKLADGIKDPVLASAVRVGVSLGLNAAFDAKFIEQAATEATKQGTEQATTEAAKQGAYATYKTIGRKTLDWLAKVFKPVTDVLKSIWNATLGKVYKKVSESFKKRFSEPPKLEKVPFQDEPKIDIPPEESLIPEAVEDVSVSEAKTSQNKKPKKKSSKKSQDEKLVTEIAAGIKSSLGEKVTQELSKEAINESIDIAHRLLYSFLYKFAQGAAYGAAKQYFYQELEQRLKKNLDEHYEALADFLSSGGAILVSQFTGYGLSKLTGLVEIIPEKLVGVVNEKGEPGVTPIGRNPVVIHLNPGEVRKTLIAQQMKDFWKDYTATMVSRAVHTAGAMTGHEEWGVLGSAVASSLLTPRTNANKKELSYSDRIVEGLKAGAISVGLQKLSLETKSPVHGAYFNLFVSSLLKSALTKTPYRANLSADITEADADMRSFGRAKPYITEEGTYDFNWQRGNDSFFIDRYYSYIKEIHEEAHRGAKYKPLAGFMYGLTSQMISSLHNQTISNVKVILNPRLLINNYEKINQPFSGKFIKAYEGVQETLQNVLDEEKKNNRSEIKEIIESKPSLTDRFNLVFGEIPDEKIENIKDKLLAKDSRSSQENELLNAIDKYYGAKDARCRHSKPALRYKIPEGSYPPDALNDSISQALIESRIDYLKAVAEGKEKPEGNENYLYELKERYDKAKKESQETLDLDTMIKEYMSEKQELKKVDIYKNLVGVNSEYYPTWKQKEVPKPSLEKMPFQEEPKIPEFEPETPVSMVKPTEPPLIYDQPQPQPSHPDIYPTTTYVAPTEIKKPKKTEIKKQEVKEVKKKSVPDPTYPMPPLKYSDSEKHNISVPGIEELRHSTTGKGFETPDRKYEVTMDKKDGKIIKTEDLNPKPVSVIVKPGDTFNKIAETYGLTPGELSRQNPTVNPNDEIYPGQEIWIKIK